MNTIYWIEILDSVCGTLLISLIIAVVCSIICFINGAMEYDEEEKHSFFNIAKKSAVISSIIAVIFIFVPNTNMMYKIIGIGSTIEYLKSNETAKQLPDKCIKALDKFLDDVSKDECDKGDKQQ